MYSLMVATAPLPDEVWEEIGLRERETFSDKRHLRIYGQRTSDGRIAFGVAARRTTSGPGSSLPRPRPTRSRVAPADPGRLLPGPPGRRVHPRLGRQPRHPAGLVPVGELRPALRSGLRRRVRGDGVATANLAGRTLAAEILDLGTDRSLPWLRRTSPEREPEPAALDRRERGTSPSRLRTAPRRASGKPSRLASGFWKALGP